MSAEENRLYDVTFTVNNDILSADTKGRRTLDVVLSIAQETIAACKDHNTQKVLIDVRKLEGRLSTIDAYNIPAEYFKDMRDPMIIKKVAIIELEEFVEEYRFFENVAVNRGYNLRVFSDITIALEWLRSDR